MHAYSHLKDDSIGEEEEVLLADKENLVHPNRNLNHIFSVVYHPSSAPLGRGFEKAKKRESPRFSKLIFWRLTSSAGQMTSCRRRREHICHVQKGFEASGIKESKVSLIGVNWGRSRGRIERSTPSESD